MNQNKKVNKAKNIIEQFQNRMIRLIEHNPDTAISQANTEAESSKDYTGRVVYEFFQNAVDRADKNIWMELTENTFIISNDGKEFSISENEIDKEGYNFYQDIDEKPKGDFHSLNSIHNGEKQAGESIGNKGVGFKSCWNVSKHVKIESIIKHANNIQEAWGFELFNPVKSKYFTERSIKNIIEKMEKKNKRLPSFYFPKYTKSKIEAFRDGAVTKITIFLKDTNAYKEIEEELKEFKKTKFLFLDLLKGKEKKEYQIHITIDGITNTINSQYSKDLRKDLKTLEKENEYYKEYYSQLLKARENETYKNIPKEPNIAISFPLDDEKLNAKFYTYLPTKIECGFNVLIHADFALDNARVSIPENNYNNTILEIAAKMLINELLNNTTLHNYKNFALFLMPKDKNDKFAKLVWEELIKDDKLTQILQKVYTKERNFSKKSYELIFNVISQWHRERNSGEWKDGYYQDIYDKTIQYFCNENIYIVWIDEKNKTFLPPKKEDRNYTYSLFVKEKDEDKLDYSLLQDIKNIKITTFESLVDKTEFFKNNILRKFSPLEILRVLKNFKNKKIIYFVQQLLDEKEELSQDVKEALLDIKIYVNEEFIEVKKCFINIDIEVQKLFTDEFKELDIDKLEGKDIEFLTKIGVANNRLPFYKDKKEIVLPFKEDTPYPKSNTMKDLISNTLFDDEVIEKLSTIQWFYDERKDKLYTPKEIFLFKEHDNRKIECIAQEKKDKKCQELYNRFNIDEIDETTDSKKLINQLKKMQHTAIDTFHQEIYKKVTYALSKIDNIEDDNIPILAFNKEKNIYQYLEDEKKEAIFLETKYKKYKNNIEEKFIVLFDTNMKKEFIKKVNIKIFEADYKIIYEPERSKKEDRKTKENIQKTFLPIFFCIADEIMGSSFEKEDILKRWENLSIYKADDVQLSLNDGKIIESTKGSDIDVLFVPIKDRNKNIYNIGNIAHDLQKPLENNNFIKFGRVIADGVFRNLKLTPYFESYISRYLLKDEKSKENYLLELGIEQVNIEEMKNFIKKNLLTQDEKDKILQILREIGLKIEQFQDIFDFQNYENIDINFKDFKSKFDDKYQFIAQNIIDSYKSYYQSKIENLVQKNQKELEILCFIQHKNREDFKNKLEQIKKKNIDEFQQEFDIYKLFDVKQIDKNSDEYIEGKIKFDGELEEIPSINDNFEIIENKIVAKETSKTGNAHKTDEDYAKDIQQQKQQQKRGKIKELDIAFEYAKLIYTYNLQEDFIKEIEKMFKDRKENDTNIKNYIENLNTYKSKFEFAKKVINIANNSLDGLGYDLLIPNIKDNKLQGVLKVELKTTTSKSDIKIYFSQPEIEKIKYFFSKNDTTFQVWLNNKKNITKNVKDAIEKLPEILPFEFESYILHLKGTVK